jgi:endonuclease YncB( thermonuclease family)
MGSEIDFTGCSIRTPEFTLRGLNTMGRLVDIIDGDSVSIVLPVFNSFYKYNIRLSGIDTCEMRSKNEKCRNLAIKARDTLLGLVTGVGEKTHLETRSEIHEILDKDMVIVYVECLDFDKYGRLLANVFFDKINLSEYLLQHKLAYSYTGHTKLTEQEQLEMLS